MAMVDRDMLFSVCLRPVSDFSICCSRSSRRQSGSWKLGCFLKPKLKLKRSLTNPDRIPGCSDDYLNWRIKTQQLQFIQLGSFYSPGKPWIRVNPNSSQGTFAGFKTLHTLPQDRSPVVGSSGSTCCAVTLSLPGISTEKDVERLEHSKSDVAMQDDNDGFVCEREKLRRHRISVANKGRVPWNKGCKHSQQTIERIKERTYQAMLSPKVRAKLRLNSRHPQTKETRAKIRDKLKVQWEAKKRIVVEQDTVVKDWGECVAEAARKGSFGEEELEWNSYFIIKKKIRMEIASFARSQKAKKLRLEKQERDRAMGIMPGKSEEHRQKIAAAIRAKWADPEYQNKVREGMTKKSYTRSKRVQTPRAPRAPRPPRAPREKKTTSSKIVVPKGPVGPVDKGFITAVMSAENKSKQSDLAHVRGDDEDISVPQKSKPRRRKVNLLNRNTLSAKQEKESLVEDTVLGAQTFVDPLASERLQTLKLHEANRLAMDQRRREAIHNARTLMEKAMEAAMVLEAVTGSDESARASLHETRRIIAEAAQFMRIAESVKGSDTMCGYDIKSHNGATPTNLRASRQYPESHLQIELREHHDRRESDNFTLSSNSTTILEADKYLHSGGRTS